MATYGRNQFRNPATSDVYNWHVNHSEEGDFGKKRNIESTANTANVGLVQQQGSDEPLVLRLTGTILHQAQFDAMKSYFNLSRTQSIIFKDFAGDEYEVSITDWTPKRVRTIRNPKDTSIRLHYWTYSLEMRVLRVIAGAWLGTTP